MNSLANLQLLWTLSSSAAEHDYTHTRVYDPRMNTSEFMELAQLCSDQTILGSHLLSLARSLAGNEQQSENCECVDTSSTTCLHTIIILTVPCRVCVCVMCLLGDLCIEYDVCIKELCM